MQLSALVTRPRLLVDLGAPHSPTHAHVARQIDMKHECQPHNTNQKPPQSGRGTSGIAVVEASSTIVATPAWPHQPCTASRHRILSGLLVQATPGLWAHTAQIHVLEHCPVNPKAATGTAHGGDNRASRTTRGEANAIIVAPRAKHGQHKHNSEGLLQAGRHGLRGDRPGDLARGNSCSEQSCARRAQSMLTHGRQYILRSRRHPNRGPRRRERPLAP